MTENECLKEVLKEFLKITETDCKNAEEVTKDYTIFFNFVEDNIHLKDAMYTFFYTMLKNYIIYRFYTEPIPALIDDAEYMRKFKRDTLKKAYKFFNYGGLIGNKG